MRKSSRGNPWHDKLGRFCHGPNADTDTWGKPISDEQRLESVCKSEKNAAYYDAKTKLRKGEISEADFKQAVEPSFEPSNHPGYDLMVEQLRQSPEIDSHADKVALFKEVCAANGVEVDVPIRKTQGKYRVGGVNYMIHPAGDTYYKDAQSVTLSARQNEGQIDTLYHEAYHFAANHGETDAYERGGRTNKSSMAMEETMAVCAARALCEDTKVESKHPSYPMYLAENLPKLKQNTERFGDCNSISDFGRIAWDMRTASKSSVWGDVVDEANSKPLPKGYYDPYITHMTQNREKIIGDMCTRWGYPDDESYRNQITRLFTSSVQHVQSGHSINTLSRNEKLVFTDALMYGFLDMGIL